MSMCLKCVFEVLMIKKVPKKIQSMLRRLDIGFNLVLGRLS